MLEADGRLPCLSWPAARAAQACREIVEVYLAAKARPAAPSASNVRASAGELLSARAGRCRGHGGLRKRKPRRQAHRGLRRCSTAHTFARRSPAREQNQAVPHVEATRQSDELGAVSRTSDGGGLASTRRPRTTRRSRSRGR
jgi:hypothetical protein